MNNDGSGWKLKLKEDINFLCVSHLILIPALFFNSMLLKFSFHLQRAFWRGTCLNFLSTKDVDCHHDIWHYLLFCNIQIWKGRQKSVEKCLIIFFTVTNSKCHIFTVQCSLIYFTVVDFSSMRFFMFQIIRNGHKTAQLINF